MRRLTQLAVLGSALIIGMTMATASAQATAAGPETRTVAADPFPPVDWLGGDDWDFHPRPGYRVLELTTRDSFNGRWRERSVTLWCNPARPGHPYRWAACNEVSGVGGNPGFLTPQPAACPRIYAPVNARAQGTWNGRTIRFQQTFGNRCLLNAATGAVFRF
ncbi:hypothetical protein Misp01_14090 [Microtetraspora sp. NBRC 13810]|uniref:SSI family serine proteinase inhibitor n=1 Tax=Microtetraspora sp. NBRC 13810 TaxID=3030990 RepID=UPI0024A21E61|nr:SSI family serine proteinase inhibitor [Microtetraspora sp. NBRC 13810]GLW06279.1 hypothetical protein Misp01_14090 [Microtetraspora sp. NBRC 13810]